MGLAGCEHIGVPAIIRQERRRGCFTTSEHIPPVKYRRLPNNKNILIVPPHLRESTLPGELAALQEGLGSSLIAVENSESSKAES